MIGAIAGDIIGSVYEARNIKSVDFPLFSPGSRFTDDTVMTVAVADALLSGRGYAESFRSWGGKYPHAGYGGFFREWLQSPAAGPYNSWGNGSAMRVSPIGFACDTIADVMREASRSAEVTHNHPEGVKGAQAVAVGVFLAREGTDREEIRDHISYVFSYDLLRPLDEIRETYSFDVSCQGSVPEAIIAFLESDSYEDAVRKAVSIGGDSDTIACITGALASAFYGEIPPAITESARKCLPPDILSVIDEFSERFGLRPGSS